MNIDILKCIINSDYKGLKDLTYQHNDHLSTFYNMYASYYLDKSYDLFEFLQTCPFDDEEVCIIYDLLAKSKDQLIINARNGFLNKYKTIINLENVYQDSDVIRLASKLELPKKENKVTNFKFYVGIGLVVLGLIGLLISLLLVFNLKEEIKYFCTVLLLAFPSPIIVLGINYICFKKQNYLIMILEAFMLVYLLSFLCLIRVQESQNLLINLKNHFFEVLKALYNFFSYYTFKALEGLE